MLDGFSIRFWNWFDNSASIVWARVQMFIGALWTIALTTDVMSSWLPPKYFAIWVIVSGVITEFMRRMYASKDQITVQTNAGVVSTVKYLQQTSPVPTGSTVVLTPPKNGG